RPDDDFAGVQADSDLDRNPFGPSDSVSVARHGFLHPQRGVAGTHRVVLVSERCTEQRHDPVAHHLIHGALVAVHGLHHAFEDGVEQLTRLLGVAVGEQFHRAFEIREEDSHLLALAFQRGLRGKDLLGDVFGDVRLGAGEAASRLGDERGAAGPTELFAGRDEGATARTRRLEPGATVLAEARARLVLSLAAGTPQAEAANWPTCHISATSEAVRRPLPNVSRTARRFTTGTPARPPV